MNFFVIPYLLAVDLVVPHGNFDYKPTFYFNVAVNSTATMENSSGISTNYMLTALMTCVPDPVSLWCCFRDTKIIHGHNFNNYSSSSIRSPNESIVPGVFSISDERFLLEFDQTGVKISSCNEKSGRSLRMIQKIVDLLNVDIDFDGERRGASRLETVTIVDDCPVTTRAHYLPIGKSEKKPGDGFFKIMSHPDEFDETSEWILEVNRTRDIKSCRNHNDYFFGSRSENDELHGSKIVINVTSSINNIKITNEKFVSIGYTEGIITTRTMKFAVKDTIAVSININNIYVPSEPKKNLLENKENTLRKIPIVETTINP